MEPHSVITCSLDLLHAFCRDVFMHVGVPPPEARQAADVLIAADRRGIDSHGVARLETYVDLLTDGAVNPTPRIEVVRETPSTATMDADNGLGLVAGPRAMSIAMEKAASAGTGWVAVRNSNHFGIAGYYVLQALEDDLIGVAMTNSSRKVAPLWGGTGMLGTNPIAAGIPADEEPPVVIDMATSVVPLGAIEVAQRKGRAIPAGWAIDRHGHSTTQPNDVVDGGALLPLGATRQGGGHKGYCLASLVDILSGVLGGAGWGPFTPPFARGVDPPERTVGKGIGHFFGAIRIDGFIEPDAFKRQMDDWIRTMRTTPPAPGTGGPLVPGDPEREAEAVRRREGVPVLLPVYESLRRIAARTGVSLD